MMDNIKPSYYSPLVLAYIGDSVYELFVREKLIFQHADMPPNKLHRLSITHVSAHAQSNSMLVIESMLNDEELSVYKRGRNAKSATVPKNADVADYRRATGFEALIGYLYLSGNKERLNELMEIAYTNTINNKN